MTTTLKRIGIGMLILVILVGLGFWLGKDTFAQYMTKKYFKNIEDKALTEPFRGVETSKGKEEGIFPIRSTGVSTIPIKEAAEAFLISLDDDLKEKIQFEIEDEEWRRWCNVDNGIYERQGVSLKEMNDEQKAAAFGLMQESLSAKGLKLSKDIMKTDQTLRELNNNEDFFDEELYFFTFMGTPSETAPWGWQLDGHHLIINYFILGDQVVMTPTFMGGEPIITTSGKYKGNKIFQDEQNIGLAFMQSLPQELQKEATLSPDKNRNNNQGEFAKDNLRLDYAGLKVSKLSDDHKAALLNLAFQYIGNMREGHNRVKMEEIEAHWENTWFAWVGETEEDAVFYYRIHSPVVLIEFDHQHPVGVPGSHSGPSRNHIHTVVRTPNGNDYGKDLLRQHLETHAH
ncbi:MAG: DUF3500 domain-containing protein [Bacteroidota bacterium]